MFSTTASPVATALTLPSHSQPPKLDTRFTSALMEHIASSPLVAGPLPVKPVVLPPTRIPAVASGAVNATADVFKVPMAVDKENKTPSVGSKGSSTPRLSEGFRMSPVVAPTTTATSVEAVKQVRVVQTISAQPSPMSDPSQTIVLKQGGEYLLPAVPSEYA